jgi:glucose-6-phosphate 1-dehydrogenase
LDTDCNQAGTPNAKSGEHRGPPCILVIFGAGGDLTRSLLTPALYNMARAKQLDEDFAIVAVGRKPLSLDAYRERLAQGVRSLVSAMAGDGFDTGTWNFVASRIRHFAGDVTEPGTFNNLAEQLEKNIREGNTANIIFYLAVPAQLFETIIVQLGAVGLLKEDAGYWRRVVIEKPFGTDLASARRLNAQIRKRLDERQVFRIDHYLGKETVQNILTLRFCNHIFAPAWNREHIDHLQITVAETGGAGRRAGFYEKTGALRDMVPNHLFDLLAVTTMEPPGSFAADAVHAERGRVLEALRRLGPEEVRRDVVRGQYIAGTIAGKPVAGYRDADGVAPDSPTETYVAMRLGIDNRRWAGVPFYLRTGKSLARRMTEISVHFKDAPMASLLDATSAARASNILILRVQPDEGIALQFGAKLPGSEMALGEVGLAFRYHDYFEIPPSTGYETLLYDCMVGDRMRFRNADSVEAGWVAVQPILDLWHSGGVPLEFYPAGADGPHAANRLLARDGRTWRPLAA